MAILTDSWNGIRGKRDKKIDEAILEEKFPEVSPCRMFLQEGNPGEQQDNQVEAHGYIEHITSLNKETAQEFHVLKKKVVLSRDGLVPVTTHVLSVSLHAAVTMNIVR